MSPKKSTSLPRPDPVLFAQQEDEILSVRETLNGKNVMIIGGTGFLGRVMLYMLLKFVPQIGKVYVLIRPTHSRSAKDRFEKEVLASPVFSTNIDDPELFASLSEQKVEIVEGDAVQEMFGLGTEECQRIQEDLDIVLNTAGNVEFNPPIDLSLNANAVATQQVLAFAAASQAKKYVHISTCYVADRTVYKDTIPEKRVSFKVLNPAGDEICMDPYAYIKSALAEVHKIKDRYARQDPGIYREEARQSLARMGQSEPSPRMIDRGIKNLISTKLREELIALGRSRAKEINRPNVYTYTKTLAELLVQSYSGQLESVIVRPSIVESSLRYPFSGWNEGIQGTAPLVYLAFRGHRMFPTLSGSKHERRTALLDCIPVDEVAAGTILAMCSLLRGEHQPVYQLAAGPQKSPLTVHTFTHIASNIREEAGRNGLGASAWLQRNVQPRSVSAETFERFSSPRVLKALTRVRKRMDSLSRAQLSKESQEFMQKMRTQVEKFYQISQTKNKIFQEFFPFIHAGYPVFQNDNAKDLHARLPKEEKAIFHFNPSEIDYLDYASDLHSRALQQWIFPILEKRFGALEKIGKTNKVSKIGENKHDKGLSKNESKRQKVKKFWKGGLGVARDLAFAANISEFSSPRQVLKKLHSLRKPPLAEDLSETGSPNAKKDKSTKPQENTSGLRASIERLFQMEQAEHSNTNAAAITPTSIRMRRAKQRGKLRKQRKTQ